VGDEVDEGAGRGEERRGEGQSGLRSTRMGFCPVKYHQDSGEIAHISLVGRCLIGGAVTMSLGFYRILPQYEIPKMLICAGLAVLVPPPTAQLPDVLQTRMRIRDQTHRARAITALRIKAFWMDTTWRIEVRDRFPQIFGECRRSSRRG